MSKQPLKTPLSIGRKVLSLFFLGMLAVSGCREQPSESHSNGQTTFSVAFYNVENLFDNEFDGNEYPEYRPDGANWNEAMYARKYENIASVIAAIDASILALCEVEDGDALHQLYMTLRKKKYLYRYRSIIDTPAHSVTHPALLSRFPINKSVGHRIVLPDTSQTREILEVEVTVHNKSLTIFVNHWPSKRYPESFRRIAAYTLQGIIAGLPINTDYIIIGDLNSNHDECFTFSSFGHNNTGGQTGINHMLGTIQPVTPITSRLRTENEAIAAPFPSHYDTWLELPLAIRMSYFYKGNRETPDHILLPPALYDTSGIAYVDNSFNTFTWGSRLLVQGKPARWKMRYQNGQKRHCGEGYSDHLPIVASFTTAPFVLDTSAIDFSDAFYPDSSNPDSWFEYHSSGWIACDDSVVYSRDTAAPAAGRYSLHVVAPAQRDNYTVVKSLVNGVYRNKKGALNLYLRGSGNLCLRTKNSMGRWRYYHAADKTASKEGYYAPFESAIWQTVTIPSNLPPGADMELELRSKKSAPLDIWIDH
jgi:hypothetical protein